jgi:transcriptional regulator with XRE-family HTH domain
MTAAVGAEVRRLREDRGWTGDELADRLRAVGLDFTQAAVVNLEGRRQTVALHELVALAAVFEVPLLALVFPDPAADVELLPGRETDGVRALAWASGQWLPAAVQTGGDVDASWRRYTGAAYGLTMLHDHEAFARDVLAVARLRGDDTDGLYRRRLAALRDLRAQMAHLGWPLPPLPDGLDEHEVDGSPDPTIDDTKES